MGSGNKPFYRIGVAGDLSYKNLELLPLFMYGHDNNLGIPGLPSTAPLPTGAQAPTFYGGFLEAHYYFNPQNVALARFEQINVGQQAFSNIGFGSTPAKCTGGDCLRFESDRGATACLPAKCRAQTGCCFAPNPAGYRNREEFFLLGDYYFLQQNSAPIVYQ